MVDSDDADDAIELAADAESSPDDVVDEDYLTRDEFNLHKIIVAVTLPGKVSETSKHLRCFTVAPCVLVGLVTVCDSV